MTTPKEKLPGNEEKNDPEHREIGIVEVPVPDIFDPRTQVAVTVGGMRSHGAVILDKRGPTGAAVRISSTHDSVETAATEHSDRTVEYSIQVKASENEQDTLEAGGILRQRLNDDGANWSAVVDVSSQGLHYDCEARDGDQRLLIQVRRIASMQFFKDLRNGRKLSRVPADTLADDLLVAIEDKRSKIQTSLIKTLTLALNAREVPIHALPVVVESFQSRHGVWAKGLGYVGIWVVGPTPGLCFRIDL